MKTVLLIINLHSGKGSIKNQLAQIIDTFNKEGYETTVEITQGRADATRIAREKAGRFNLVVCSGGDGTLSEVVDGLMELDPADRPGVGYIPAGSTNDYAYSLAIPTDITECVDMICRERYMSVDIGRFNEEYFIYVAAFGAFTEVSWNTPQKEKNALGHNAYILEGIRQLGKIKPYHVKVILDTGEEIIANCMYAMVYNSVSVGGMRGLGNKEVLLDDGKLNLMLVLAPDSPVEFSVLLADLVLKNPTSKYVSCYEISEVTFESEEEIEWVLDGEYGGSHKKVHIQTIPCAVSIAIPSEEPDKSTAEA